MAAIVVLGGGVCGLAAGMLLARDGHEVSLVDRDPEPVPATVEEAWFEWPRRGVVQFRQPHFLQARVRQTLERELPDVLAALVDAGAAHVDPIARLPAAIGDRERRPDDARFESVTARRTTVELVFASLAAEEPRLQIRRGLHVVGVTTRVYDAVPHVTGVRLSSGDWIAADLVVDAMGRRSPLPKWLAEAGAPPMHEEAEDCGFIYYTRFFRSADGSCPEPRTPTLVTPLGSFSILTLPGDCNTWSVTFFVSSGDRPLKRLREPARWATVIAACPLHAHWLDGEPISDVLAMAGVLDRYRRIVVGERSVVTGAVLVADAWACTNPSLARGLALGLDHVARLRDVVRSSIDDPSELARVWDEVTEKEFTPWYRATVATDRARLAEMEALREDNDPPPPASPAAVVRARFPRAASRDPDLYRALMEMVGCLTLPAEVFARPGLAKRVLEVTEERETPQPQGPTRAQLLELLD